MDHFMLSRLWIRLAAFCAAVILAAALFYAWRTERRDRGLLAADLAKTQQALSEATARQFDRDQQLAKLLASFEERKRTVVAPEQIIQQLPRELPLPVPLMLAPTTTPEVGGAQHAAPLAGAPSHPLDVNTLPQVALPAADLKPLYDFAVDCNACQARLAAASSDLADERTKSAAVGRERDNALRIARGGTIWRRVGHAAKWFIIGAAAGAAAAKARTLR
jgi:hypothetical protein